MAQVFILFGFKMVWHWNYGIYVYPNVVRNEHPNVRTILEWDSTMGFETWTTLSSVANTIGIRAYVIPLDLVSCDFEINKIAIAKYGSWDHKYDILSKVELISQCLKYNMLKLIIGCYTKITWIGILSMFGQTACPKIIRDVHLWG